METKSPAVLFYTSDFLTGTMLMTNEQVGKYIRALCYQHQQGHLSEEDMLNICGTYEQKIYEKFIKDDNNKYFNKRMDLEIEKRNNYSASRSKNRCKSKAKPKKHMSNISKSYEQHMENDNDNKYIYINSNLDIDRGMGEEEDIYTFIEKNFGRPLGSIEYEEIGLWEDNELTRYAVKQAVLNGAYNIKYINTILNNWKQKNITSVQQAQEEDRKFKESKIVKKTSTEKFNDVLKRFEERKD